MRKGGVTSWLFRIITAPYYASFSIIIISEDKYRGWRRVRGGVWNWLHFRKINTGGVKLVNSPKEQFSRHFTSADAPFGNTVARLKFWFENSKMNSVCKFAMRKHWTLFLLEKNESFYCSFEAVAVEWSVLWTETNTTRVQTPSR